MPGNTEWKPGQSGNPKGRPKFSITVALEKRLQKLDPENKKAIKDAIADVWVSLALKGDLEAIKSIANRVEGTPKQAIDMTSNGQTIKPIYGGVSVPEHNGDEKDI